MECQLRHKAHFEDRCGNAARATTIADAEIEISFHSAVDSITLPRQYDDAEAGRMK